MSTQLVRHTVTDYSGDEYVKYVVLHGADRWAAKGYCAVRNDGIGGEGRWTLVEEFADDVDVPDWAVARGAKLEAEHRADLAARGLCPDCQCTPVYCVCPKGEAA